MANKKQAAARMEALNFEQSTSKSPDELKRIVERTLDAGKRFGNSSIVIEKIGGAGAELHVKGAMKMGTSAEFVVNWAQESAAGRTVKLRIEDYTLSKASGMIAGALTGGWDCVGRKSVEKYSEALRSQL